MSIMKSKPQTVLSLSWASLDKKVKLQPQWSLISSPVRKDKGDQENKNSCNHQYLYL